MENTFGIKTLFFYIYQRVTLGLVLLILGANLPGISQFIISMGNINLGQTSIETVNRVGNILMAIIILLSLFIIVLGLVLSIIKYISSTYILEDYALVLRHGLIGKTEVLIPYKQIQSVDTNQSIFLRIIGLSNLVVLSAGNEEGRSGVKADEVFRVIDSRIAEYLKEELLRRANLR